ncbi:MAG: DNA repair protein RecO [Candidatus Komeilibacteria bacterium]
MSNCAWLIKKMPYIKQTVIVLNKKSVRQADRWYTLLCCDNGKQDVIVRGAAKSSSKLAGHLEVGNKAEVMLAPGKNVVHLAGAKVLDSYRAINNDYDSLLLKWIALKKINELTYGDEVSVDFFEAVDDFLSVIGGENKDWSTKVLLYNVLMMHLVTIAGYQIVPRQYFEPQNASFVDQASKQTIKLDRKTLLTIKFGASQNIGWCEKFKLVPKIKLNNEQLKTLHTIVNTYFKYYISAL